MVYAALICERFGWTYDEFMNQPEEFLDAITAKDAVENNLRKIELAKMR